MIDLRNISTRATTCLSCHLGNKSKEVDHELIASGQAVEHYEMARYGTLIAWAKQLGMPDAAQALSETLQEEKAADRLLSKISLGAANKKAAAY